MTYQFDKVAGSRDPLLQRGRWRPARAEGRATHRRKAGRRCPRTSKCARHVPALSLWSSITGRDLRSSDRIAGYRRQRGQEGQGSRRAILVRSAADMGFTLVELLVVLLIMSLLLVAVPLAFDRILPGLQVRSDARDLANTLREARSLAILGNREATVTVDVEERSYRLDGNAGQRHFSDGVVVTLETAASEVTGTDTGRIRFFPDGTSTGGLVSLDQQGHQYEIEVDWLYGRVRIQE